MARNTILVADDDEENRDFLKSLFQDDYTVAVTANGRQAMEFLMQNHQDVAVLLLDMHMPVVDGRALLKVLKVKGVTQRIPVVMMTTTLDDELVKECYENGAVDFVLKPFNAAIVVGRVKNTIALYHNSAQLKGIISQQTAQIKEKNKELKATNDRLMEVMSSIVEFRNLESNAHIKKIKGISRILAEAAVANYGRDYHLTPEMVDIIESSSALHDIGMITIPDSILLKPGKLTADEFEVVKSHTTRGCEILEQIQELQSKEYVKVSYNICRHHHEKFDGSGYPDHLAGDAIPVEAQIVGLADVYDSLISDRPFRDAFDPEKAYSMVTGGEAGVFSEKLLDCFTRSRDQIEHFCAKYSS
ncbi:MAG: response regulator [Lachnospiraceae bacterium]|nr:response regulator [Lachnospiraceae bacterium]